MKIFKQARVVHQAPGVPKPTSVLSAREQQIERILAEVKDELLKELPDSPGKLLNIDEIEHLALEVRERVGRLVAQELTQEQADVAEAEVREQEESNKHNCHRCAKLARYRGRREKAVVTMAGPVQVMRRVYYCKRCDCCTMPVDRQLGLPVHGYTALVERWVAELCGEHAYHRGGGVLWRLGRVDVSKKEAQRITLAVGGWLEERLRQQVHRVFQQHPTSPHIQRCQPERIAPQRCERGKRLYVLMDGVMTPMKDGTYREAKVGCSLLVGCEADGEQKVLESYYTHSMEDAESFGKDHYTMTAAAGLVEAPKVIAIGDGAHWIWNQVRRHYPGAIQILDWYHALEHLHEVAKTCLLPAHSDAEVRGWVKGVETKMWHGRTQEVIQAVKALPADTEQAQQLRRVTAEYYDKNQNRMHYNRYREQGLQVGSGAIESACKQIVSARVKGAGMRWSEAGAKAIGRIRAALLSTQGAENLLGAWNGRQLTPVASF